MRSAISYLALAGSTLVTMSAAAQCLQDTDCEGTRVCDEGKCVEPAGAPARVPPPPGPPQAAPAGSQLPPAYPPGAQPKDGEDPWAAQPPPGSPQPAPAGSPPPPAYPPGVQPKDGEDPWAAQPPPSPPQAAPAGFQVVEQPGVSDYQAAPVYQQPVPFWREALNRPLEWYSQLYGHIGASLGFHGWGSLNMADTDITLSGQSTGGVSISLYAPLSARFHVGGYFDYSRGSILQEYGGNSGNGSFEHYSTGVSVKVGKRLTKRLWLGATGDLGLYVLSPSHANAWHGVEISPRVHLDVLGLDLDGFKMGLFASLGPSIVPYVAGSDGGYDGSAYLVYLQMRIGFTFGDRWRRTPSRGASQSRDGQQGSGAS